MKAAEEIRRQSQLIGFLNRHAIVYASVVVEALQRQMVVELVNLSESDAYYDLKRSMILEALDDLDDLAAEWSARKVSVS